MTFFDRPTRRQLENWWGCAVHYLQPPWCFLFKLTRRWRFLLIHDGFVLCSISVTLSIQRNIDRKWQKQDPFLDWAAELVTRLRLIWFWVFRMLFFGFLLMFLTGVIGHRLGHLECLTTVSFKYNTCNRFNIQIGDENKRTWFTFSLHITRTKRRWK